MTSVRRTRTALATLPLLLGVAVTGCSGDGPDTTSAQPGATPTSSSTGMSATDADFVRNMHGLARQGLRMSHLVPGAGGSSDVRHMARRMISAQQGDLESLAAVRDAMERGSMPMMNGSMGEKMRDGMMSARHLDRLSHLHGTQFDARFLEMMITHHRSMVAAALDERAHGSDPATRRLAGMMAVRGRAQLKQMSGMMGR